MVPPLQDEYDDERGRVESDRPRERPLADSEGRLVTGDPAAEVAPLLPRREGERGVAGGGKAGQLPVGDVAWFALLGTHSCHTVEPSAAS
jgi:hypothetical protein